MQAQQHISKSGHSQIELVLVEQICTNLEINLGKNYLGSILSTLHAEDSLSKLVLGSVDALRSLILRYSHRITLSTDCYGAEMASLVVTNAIWQQQQQQQQQCVQAQKEKLHVSEHNGQSHEEFTITNDLWYYADDEGNIHVSRFHVMQFSFEPCSETVSFLCLIVLCDICNRVRAQGKR